jgi:hypothetical protein
MLASGPEMAQAPSCWRMSNITGKCGAGLLRRRLTQGSNAGARTSERLTITRPIRTATCYGLTTAGQLERWPAIPAELPRLHTCPQNFRLHLSATEPSAAHEHCTLSSGTVRRALDEYHLPPRDHFRQSAQRERHEPQPSSAPRLAARNRRPAGGALSGWGTDRPLCTAQIGAVKAYQKVCRRGRCHIGHVSEGRRAADGCPRG